MKRHVTAAPAVSDSSHMSSFTQLQPTHSNAASDSGLDEVSSRALHHRPLGQDNEAALALRQSSSNAAAEQDVRAGQDAKAGHDARAVQAAQPMQVSRQLHCTAA